MSDLYELTRKLVARGCPDCPWFEWSDDRELFCYEGEACPDEMVRAGWTMWALEWYATEGHPADDDDAMDEFDREYLYARSCAGFSRDAILEAIEAATRHLEPSKQ